MCVSIDFDYLDAIYLTILCIYTYIKDWLFLCGQRSAKVTKEIVNFSIFALIQNLDNYTIHFNTAIKCIFFKVWIIEAKL